MSCWQDDVKQDTTWCSGTSAASSNRIIFGETLLRISISRAALEVVHAIILALFNIFISATCWTSSSTVFSNDTNDGSHHFWDMYKNPQKRLFMQKLHDKIKNTTAMSDEEVRDVFNIHRLSSEERATCWTFL
jgi:hypothetical protein